MKAPIVFYENASGTCLLWHGDCVVVMEATAADSVDAIVTDGPYGIGFMGREWDTFKPGTGATRKLMHPRERARAKIESDNKNINGRHRSPALSPSQIDYDYSVAGLRRFQEWTEQWARAAFRVLKPGGYILSCGAPRAYHRMACGLEDAGFEIRDSIAWLFGSGFPKSLNIGDGRGTALKPAHEPIVMARKPFKGSVKSNVERFGTGALNIDACRIGSDVITTSGDLTAFDRRKLVQGYRPNDYRTRGDESEHVGRWPANVACDEEAAAEVDAQSGELTSGAMRREVGAYAGESVTGFLRGRSGPSNQHGDSGGASRFYYVAKPSRSERDFGIFDLEETSGGEATGGRKDGSAGLRSPRAGAGRTGGARNFHPTVKPVELMRWLVRLVTPPGGLVLDPFLGSGTTGLACRYEGFRFVGIEREADYLKIAERRIRFVAPLLDVETAVGDRP